jgi:hypothetical protein
MKRLLSGIKELFLRHKILSIICVLAFVIIIMIIYIFCSIFVGGTNKYGNRLEGIKEVEISKSDISDVKKKIEDNSEVSSAKVRVTGKIVYFDIDFTSDTSKDKAKEIANKVIDNFDKNEQEFYDFEFILTQSDKEDGFKLTGTKGPKTKGISFIKS